MTHVQWLAPSPLWDELSAAADKTSLRRPSVLRFATDTFMEDLQGVLAKKSTTLRNYVAQPESWEKPAAGLPASSDRTTSTLPLKLYQPVHQRFYLVSAALTCRVPGLPDHTITPAQGERVAFVLRRVAAATAKGDVHVLSGRAEFAWIPGTPNAWTTADGNTIAAGEEQIPLFPMRFGTNGHSRRVFAGLIPVSNRQEYATARLQSSIPQMNDGGNASADASDSAVGDPRLVDFQRKVLDPWVDLRDWYDRTVVPGGDQAKPDVVAGADHGTALVLLDFATYLSTELGDLWRAIQQSARPAPGPQRDLYDALGATLTREDGGSPITLREALLKAKAVESELESATFVVPPTLPSGYVRVSLTDAGGAVRALIDRDAQQRRPLSTYLSAAIAALPAPSPAGAGAVQRVPAMAPASPQGDDWFVVRCVYARPQCGAGTVITSDPSEPFQLASFFDPDAPARAIQVALPIDTTPAALRKYDKGVGFLVSDELAKQMNRVQGLKGLMAGEVGGPGLGIGMICSLSIPIITICAFIVLMIFLYLLNIIFWWIPFFKICFPVPTLKAKGA